MSKNPQDRNRVPGQDEEGEDMEKMPRKDVGEQKKGQQGWNKEQGQTGQQGGQQQGDPMNRQKDTDEQTEDDRKRRPA